MPAEEWVLNIHGEAQINYSSSQVNLSLFLVFSTPPLAVLHPGVILRYRQDAGSSRTCFWAESLV